MVWTNAPARVYHGTTLARANSIRTRATQLGTNGIDLALGRGGADFGRGFYVTTVLHQAEQWANVKVTDTQPSIQFATTAADTAAVLVFEVERDLAGRCDHLTFVVEDLEFHQFVLFNRLGNSAHARGGGDPYDMVYGPVAAYPQSITYSDCDQICFLTDRALAALGPPLPDRLEGFPLFP